MPRAANNANWELVQQQMKRAGTWRLGLRRDVLRQLGTLGRDARFLQTPTYMEGGMRDSGRPGHAEWYYSLGDITGTGDLHGITTLPLNGSDFGLKLKLVEGRFDPQ